VLEHRVELKIVDWDDVPFREAVDRAWDTIRGGAVDIDSTTAAAHLQLSHERCKRLWPKWTLTAFETTGEVFWMNARFDRGRHHDELNPARVQLLFEMNNGR